MSESARKAAIEAVEELRKSRVVVISSSWRHDMRHDLGVDGARAFVEVFEGLERPDILSLFVVTRGGHAHFADQVIRTIRATNTKVEVLVPTFCNGVATLLAMYASGVALHPHGGIGAYDCGPMVADAARLDHDLMDYVPALGGVHYQQSDPYLPARLASGVRERKLARELALRICPDDEVIGGLSHATLGTSTGLGAAELAAMGVDAEIVDEAVLWRLFCELEDVLELRAAPPPAYTESDLADEVEFEPAVQRTSAIIESSGSTLSFTIDTGRPAPDTGEFVGQWNWG